MTRYPQTTALAKCWPGLARLSRSVRAGLCGVWYEQYPIGIIGRISFGYCFLVPTLFESRKKIGLVFLWRLRGGLRGKDCWGYGMIFIILGTIAAIALIALICGATKGAGVALISIGIAGAFKTAAWALA